MSNEELAQTKIAGAYGALLLEHHKACRTRNDDIKGRALAAIFLFEQLWPEETRAWRIVAGGESENT